MGKSDAYGQLYALENGEYIPVNVKRPGRKPKYPLHQLRIGESFFIPGAVEPLNSVYQRARKRGMKVKQKVVTEEDSTGQPLQGVRVWYTGNRDDVERKKGDPA